MVPEGYPEFFSPRHELKEVEESVSHLGSWLAGSPRP